ncbi:MAG: exodeoxyribonuclease VII large subunit [Candidatus Magnetoglobus multicellularis str. Araruama]|uniref:Exodeoxyribonuclease VII large subunit n=1 Tax=Candidatus Magnetoglobus multicellularis str. Araruama TaxID=890399 RepID=A0A1V1PI66_9BACT|nr:MAG: exodeoxyribonuclease VII large subunit [Candidatus Magnetoglobus multicellularis str. Araruama]
MITSPQGAVIHDIMNVLSQRFLRPVQLVPVNVQGHRASREIISAIQLINRQKRSDVIIIARGGGSLEDLQAFNTETVARSVFESQIPVVSAVGHETDYTIIDFVADYRAPTPTAAAARIVPERRELINQLNAANNALIQALTNRIQYKRLALKNLSSRLKTPRRMFEDMRMKLDISTQNLIDRMNRKLITSRDRLRNISNRMSVATPYKRIMATKKELAWQTRALSQSIKKYYDQRQAYLNNLQARLMNLSPYTVLERGYSITRLLPDNTIVKSAESLQAGQRLDIMLASGRIEVIVKKIN